MFRRAGGWLRGSGRSSESPEDGIDRLLQLLFVDYPANPPLHAGTPTSLTEAEQDANFAQFLDLRSKRLAFLARYFRDRGIDVRPMLDPVGDGLTAARNVDDWLNETLPNRPFSTIAGDLTPNPDYRAFRASTRDGVGLYHSFLADLGLLEGEAIRLRDARFEWAVNRLEDFDDMSSFHRICLMKPGMPDWAATVFEMDEAMLWLCHAKMAPRFDTSGHWFGELLQGAMNRGYDPPSRS